MTNGASAALLSRVAPGPNCWEWLGRRDHKGYGKFQRRMAHRAVYEATIGEIPDGLQLDHLCRNRGCVNPAHLEPVTSAENTRRGVGIPAINAAKLACARGHLFTPENTYTDDRRRRDCRACHVRRQTEYRARRSGQRIEVAK